MLLCPFCMKYHNDSVEICPEKDIKIPAAYREDRDIPVVVMLTIGYSQHGKTCFLSSFFHTLIENKISDHWKGTSYTCLNQKTLNRMNAQYVNLLKKGRVPESTQLMFPTPLILRLHQMPLKAKRVLGEAVIERRDVTFIFYDISGEAFGRVDDHEGRVDVNEQIRKYAPVLKETNTLIFLISLPSLMEEAEQTGNSVYQLLQKLLNAVYIALRELGQKKEKNIIVCFTMADRMEKGVKNGNEARYGPLSERLTHTLPEVDELLAYFTDLEHHSEKFGQYISKTYSSFYGQLINNFGAVRFTSISALGVEPMQEADGKKIPILNPAHVFDPILWMLQLEGYIHSDTEQPSNFDSKTSDKPQKQIRFGQHYFTRTEFGFGTVSMTYGLKKKEQMKLEEYSLYKLPQARLYENTNHITPEKYVFYSLNPEQYVVGRAIYKGHDNKGRPGNYLFHNLLLPQKDIHVFHRNPATLVKWLIVNKQFGNKPPANDQLDPLKIPVNKLEEFIKTVDIEEHIIFHLVYYCFYAETLRKPLLLIGSEDKCLDFLEWLYSILPFHLRESLSFDIYAYESPLDFRIVCLPPEQEYQQNIPCSIRFDLINEQCSIHFEVTESEERIEFITQKIVSGKMKELYRLYVFEDQVEHGNYANLKDDYAKLSPQDQDSLFALHKDAILLYIAQKKDLELLGMIQERIMSIEDLQLLSSSSKALSELLLTDEEKINALVKDWLSLTGDGGLHNPENWEERQLAQGLFEAYEALPDSDSENENLFRVFLKYELSQREELLGQLTTSNLGILSAEQQEYVLPSVIRGIRNISAIEQKERQLNTLLANALKNKPLFSKLIPLIQQAGLQEISSRIAWIIEAGEAGNLSEVEALFTLESCLRNTEHKQLKQKYGAASPDVKEIFMTFHKESVLRHIVKHQDADFLQSIRDKISTADDMAVLAESTALARRFIENNENTSISILIEFLCSTRKNTGALYPLLYEKPPLWNAFFDKIREVPKEHVGFLLEFMRILPGQSYSLEFEDALLESVMSLLAAIQADSRRAQAFFKVLETIPASQSEAGKLLRAYLAYSLKKSSSVFEHLIRSNFALLSEDHAQLVLNGIMEEIKNIRTADEREEYLSWLFRGILEEKLSAPLLIKSIEKFALQESSQRISIFTRMAIEGRIDDIRRMFSLESALVKQEYLRFKEEYFSVSPEIQSLMALFHKSAILKTIANHQDAEFVLSFRNSLSDSDDIHILSAVPDIIRVLIADEDRRILELVVEWLLSQRNAQHFYLLLFESIDLWQIFFQRLRVQPQNIGALLEPVRLLQKDYRQEFEKMLLEEMLELLPHIKAERYLTENVFITLDSLPNSCPKEQLLLRHFVEYELSEAPYLLKQLLENNIFELDGRYHKLVLGSVMKGILKTEPLSEREQQLEKLFTLAVKNRATLFIVGTSVEQNGLKTLSPRISLMTEMSVKGNIEGMNTLYALEYSIKQGDFSRFTSEYSRIEPAMKDCIVTCYKKAILQHIVSQSDQELLYLIQEKITDIDDITRIAANPKMLHVLLQGQGNRITEIFLDNLFVQNDRSSLYPLLFKFPDLWKEFLQRLYSQPQHLSLLVEAIKIFPDYYTEALERVWLESMVSRLFPLIKEQGMAEEIFSICDRRFPSVKHSDEVKILRHFVFYELHPTDAGLEELSKSHIFILSDDMQGIMFDSMMLNGLMPLKGKDDVDLYLRRLFQMAPAKPSFFLLLITAVEKRKSSLSKRSGKMFRVSLSKIQAQFPDSQDFIKVRQKMTRLIDSLPPLSFWEKIFGI